MCADCKNRPCGYKRKGVKSLVHSIDLTFLGEKVLVKLKAEFRVCFLVTKELLFIFETDYFFLQLCPVNISEDLAAYNRIPWLVNTLLLCPFFFF